MVKRRVADKDAPGPSNPSIPKKPRTGGEKPSSKSQGKSTWETLISKKKVTPGRAINLDVYEKEKFFFVEHFKNLGWVDFLSYFGPLYTDVVKAFYSNRIEPTSKAQTFSTSLKGVDINLTPRTFNAILGVPNGDFRVKYGTNDYVKGFDLKTFVPHICEIMPSNLEKSFSSNLLKMEYRLLHHFVNHIFAPVKGNYGDVMHFQVYLMWCIETEKPLDLGYLFVDHMNHIYNRGNTALIHGMILTKVFNHFEIDLRQEKYEPFLPSHMYDIASLHRMYFVKNDDGIWVKAPNHPSFKASVSTSSIPLPTSSITPDTSPQTIQPPSIPIPSQSTPPPPAAQTPASSSAAPISDPDVLARLDAMEASNLAFQTQALQDLAFLKQEQIQNAARFSKMEIFMNKFIDFVEARRAKPQTSTSQGQPPASPAHAHVPSTHAPMVSSSPASAAAPVSASALQAEMFEKEREKVNKLLAEKGIKPIPPVLEPSAPTTKPPSPPAQTGKAAAHVEEQAATPTTSEDKAPDMTPAQHEKPATEGDFEAPADEAPATPATTEIDSDIEIANPRPLASQPLAAQGNEDLPSHDDPPSPIISPLAANPEKQVIEVSSPSASDAGHKEQSSKESSSDSDDDRPISSKLKSFKRIEEHLQGLLGSKPILDPLLSAPSALSDPLPPQTQLLFPMPISAVPLEEPPPSLNYEPVVLPPKETAPTKAYTRTRRTLKKKAEATSTEQDLEASFAHLHEEEEQPQIADKGKKPAKEEKKKEEISPKGKGKGGLRNARGVKIRYVDDKKKPKKPRKLSTIQALHKAHDEL
ncbi:hypothetical protein U1Q18_039189, partial [Sarracenia purpurea var. burkii]